MTSKWEKEFIRLVKKYLKGGASEAETAFLHKYYAYFDKREDILSDFTPEERDRLGEEIRAGLPGKQTRPAAEMLVRGGRSRRQVFRAAAVIALLVAGGILFWQYRGAVLEELALSFGPDKQVRTEKGERELVVLSDGTRVWLGPASRLTYPESFPAANRVVELEGEAFFNVTRDTTRPFFIRSGSVETRVLGTSFNIRAYADQPTVGVIVVSGTVEVSTSGGQGDAGNEEVRLVANQRALFDKEKQSLTWEEYPDAIHVAERKEGKLRYSGASMSEVMHDLSLQYDADIRLEGNVSNCLWYGEFDIGEGLAEAIKRISLTIDISVEEQDGEYVIEGPGCAFPE